MRSEYKDMIVIGAVIVALCFVSIMVLLWIWSKPTKRDRAKIKI